MYPTVESVLTKQTGNWLPRMTNDQLGAFWEDMAYGDWGDLSEDQIAEGIERVNDRYSEDTQWVLKKLPVTSIEGHHTGHDASKEYIEEYKQKKLEGSDFPPIICEQESPGKYKTIDGQHRLFAAKAIGQKDILAYVPMDAP
jgi:hypothetical protein